MIHPRISLATFVLAGSLVLGVLGAGCASSSGGSSAPATPAGPGGKIELDKTKWKLTLNGGSFDGRVIEFKKEKNGYWGLLTEEMGRQLANNTAAHPGVWMFQLLETDTPNIYRGVYRPIGGSEGEATFSVSADGKEFRCSLIESTFFREQ